MASLLQTPENPVYGQYTWRSPKSPDTDDQRWPPDAVLAGSQEHLPWNERLPMPYSVSPGVLGDSLPSKHIANWSPVADPMLAWELGTEGFQVSGDPRFGGYSDEGCLGLTERVISGTPLLATDACLDTVTEDVPGVELGSSQYGEGPNQDCRIEDIGRVPSQTSGVAENGLAPPLPPIKLSSAVHSATALGYPAKKDLTEVSSETNLIPTANVTPDSRKEDAVKDERSNPRSDRTPSGSVKNVRRREGRG